MDIGSIFVPTEEGYWVNEKYARLAEIIQDYDPTIQLAWIPPERLAPGDKPYAVMHSPTNLQPYVMFTLTEEEIENAPRVLARIFDGDIYKGKNPLAQLEAEERGRKLMDLKAKMEASEERRDFIASVVGSGKHYYKHNGRVIPT